MSCLQNPALIVAATRDHPVAPQFYSQTLVKLYPQTLVKPLEINNMFPEHTTTDKSYITWKADDD